MDGQIHIYRRDGILVHPGRMINIDKWKLKFLLMKTLFKASTFFSELLLHFLEDVLLICNLETPCLQRETSLNLW